MRKASFLSALGFLFFQLQPPRLAAGTLSLDCSTYLGGSGDDCLYGVAQDAEGGTYVVGYTLSPDFPVLGSYQATNAGDKDVFVSKLVPSGSIIVYSTYLGGESEDCGYAIVIGTADNAYITGFTTSTDFPVVNPYQAAYSGVSRDIFVSRLSSAGNVLVYSTFLGGDGLDYAEGIALAAGDEACVAGQTSSSNFPTRNPYQAALGGPGTDVCVTRIAGAGSALVYSTYLGGADSDQGRALAIGTDGSVFVCGDVYSSDFPTANAYQAVMRGSSDAFASRFVSSGSALVFSTYLGGTGSDWASGIVLGEGGEIFVSGSTNSADYPTENPYQGTIAGSNDPTVLKLSSSGSTLVYSTYLGGSAFDFASGITLGTAGQVWVCGQTFSNNFPTLYPYQAWRRGSADAFMSRLAASGSALIHSTYLGGTSGESEIRIAGGTEDKVCIAGNTYSTNFPTMDSYQASHNGTIDAFISSLSIASTPSPSSTPAPSPTPTPEPTATAITPPPSPEPSATSSSEPTPTPTVEPTKTPEPIATATLPLPSPTPSSVPLVYKAVISSGDYDGNGTSDIALFRPSSGQWSVRNLTRCYMGSSNDQPASADYDGDRTANMALFRPSTGQWFVYGNTRLYFGTNGDIPAPGDYQGDGTAEITVFRGGNGCWYVRNLTRIYFGASGDWPLPEDYNGDGIEDMAVFRTTPSGSFWAVLNLTRFYFGAATDWPISVDMNGNGTAESGVFRPSTGMWSVRNVTRFFIGASSDWPRPADYNGDGMTDPGIFRDPSGLWMVRDLTRIYFGGASDIPVTR